MKQILILTSVAQTQQNLFLEAAKGTTEEAGLLFRDADTVSDEELALADVIIGLPSPAQVQKAPKVSWVQLFTAGTDPFMKEGVLLKDTVLTNAASAHALSVSEHAVALTFALIRHLKAYAALQEAKRWEMLQDVISVEDAVIAVLGLGESGGAYAKKVKALGAYVIGVRNRDLEKPDYLDEQFTIEHLDEVLPRADIVTMVLPGGEKTYHIMDEKRLRLMKQDAYLVNVGRGTAIDPVALQTVLEDGHLGGAAIDVTETEPLPAESPLWGVERLLITPHVASNFLLPATKDRAVKIAADNLHRYLCGEALTNVVDRSLGYAG